jgi:hypothetical protein
MRPKEPASSGQKFRRKSRGAGSAVWRQRFSWRARASASCCSNGLTPRPLGFGLMIQPTDLAVLARLGLADRVRREAARINRLSGMAKGRVVLDVSYGAMTRGDRFGIGIHRALRRLRSRCPHPVAALSPIQRDGGRAAARLWRRAQRESCVLLVAQGQGFGRLARRRIVRFPPRRLTAFHPTAGAHSLQAPFPYAASAVLV